MRYLLLAWSQGNIAAQSGCTKHACPYITGAMREAWFKGYALGKGKSCHP